MQQTYITLNDGNKIPQFGMGVHGDKNLINEPVFTELGKKYDKTNVQIILHWNIQEGNIIFPKSTNPQHIRDNFDSFDFELTADDEVGVIEKAIQRL